MFAQLQDASLRKFIQGLPKTETHLHIEGALPMECLRQLDPEKYREDPAQWAPGFRYSTFDEFNEFLLGHALLWFTSAERYHEAAKILFARHVEQGVRYVETSFHSGAAVINDFDPQEAIDAILDAAPEGLEVRVWMGLLRFEDDPEVHKLFRDCHNWPRLTGVDLHGTETFPILDWTVELWERCRAAGKVNKAHAGEFGGPEYVVEALDKLKVDRIQHGIRSVEETAVVQRLVSEGVTLDVTPISNLKLAPSVASMAEHPIRDLFDAGVRCTLSTDDPFTFGNRVLDEYAELATELDFTRAELGEIAKNGFRVAQISETERKSHLAEVDAFLAGA